jgi:hypothetical protein
VEPIYYEVGERQLELLSEYAEVGEALMGAGGGADYTNAQPEPDLPLYSTLGGEGLDFYDTAMAKDMGPMYDEGNLDYHDVSPEPESGTFTMAVDNEAMYATGAESDYAAGVESLFEDQPELFAEQPEGMYALASATAPDDTHADAVNDTYAMGAEVEATYASATQEDGYGAIAERESGGYGAVAEEDTYAMGAEDTYALGAEQDTYALTLAEPTYGLQSEPTYSTLRQTSTDSQEGIYGIADGSEGLTESGDCVYSTATLRSESDDPSDPTYSVATVDRNREEVKYQRANKTVQYQRANQTEAEYGLASAGSGERTDGGYVPVDTIERRATEEEAELRNEAIYAMGNAAEEFEL